MEIGAPGARSLTPALLGSLRFTAEHVATLKTLGEFKGKQELYQRQTPQILASLKKRAIIESTESSNRLEGVTAEPQRVRALAEDRTTPATRSEQEIAGYRQALDLIHTNAANMPFSVNVVHQLHATIFRFLPHEGGRFKPMDNEIVERGPDGGVVRVRFRPVAAVSTPQAMENLVAAYGEAAGGSSREPLVLVPLTVLDFLCIHPYRDGNGRVARLLSLLLLYQHGHRVGRYISLERIIEESKETYYETLETSSRGWHEGEHDPLPWMTYFWGVLLAAYGELEERVGTLDGARGAKTEQVRGAVERRRHLGRFKIAEIRDDCPGVSPDMVSHVLRGLRDAGIIEARGRGRGAYWVYVDAE